MCGLVLVHLPVRAAVLIHEYALRGTLADSNGGNTLSAFGGEITALGYVFAANHGLVFSSSALTPKNYSIEFSFNLNSTAGFTKLIDFHNPAADPGLYQQNGRLGFTPYAKAEVTELLPGINAHVVLTRDGTTNLVTAYVNGIERFSFADDEFHAVPSGLNNGLSFFFNQSSDPHYPGGTLNYLRVFNGALTGSEVNALFAAGPPDAIPEPSSVILITLGTLGVLATHRLRGRWPPKARGRRCRNDGD